MFTVRCTIAVGLLVLLFAVLADSAVNVSDLPQCPFSRWKGSPRWCYECRWCPFRAASCCEMEDEVDTLKSVNVSGSNDWDCFITIVHFQQCGRCDPAAKNYTQVTNAPLPWVWHPLNLSIRICKPACRYIYRQCTGVSTLKGGSVVPDGMSEDAFCSDFPEESTPGKPCYNGCGRQTLLGALLLLLLLMIVLQL